MGLVRRLSGSFRKDKLKPKGTMIPPSSDIQQQGGSTTLQMTGGGMGGTGSLNGSQLNMNSSFDNNNHNAGSLNSSHQDINNVNASFMSARGSDLNLSYNGINTSNDGNNIRVPPSPTASGANSSFANASPNVSMRVPASPGLNLMDDQFSNASKPITLKLGENRMVFDEGAWRAEHLASGPQKTIVNRVEVESAHTKQQITQLKTSNQKLQEENNMLQYKLDLLLDMMSLQTLDTLTEQGVMKKGISPVQKRRAQAV